MNIFVLICLIIFLFYIIILKKEKFSIENDERCKKKGQVFSDFLPGTICIGLGKIKQSL
jgi:hypothetical protein